MGNPWPIGLLFYWFLDLFNHEPLWSPGPVDNLLSLWEQVLLMWSQWRGLTFVSVCENQISLKLHHLLYDSVREIDSHVNYARIDYMICVESEAMNGNDMYYTRERYPSPELGFWDISTFDNSPGVVTPYTKVGHRRVLKFQKDPYFARFQGQFLKKYPLFCIKTRTVLLSKTPLFLPIQGHFQKIPLFVQNSTEITQVPRCFRLKASSERGFYGTYATKSKMFVHIPFAPWEPRNERPGTNVKTTCIWGGYSKNRVRTWKFTALKCCQGSWNIPYFSFWGHSLQKPLFLNFADIKCPRTELKKTPLFLEI